MLGRLSFFFLLIAIAHAGKRGTVVQMPGHPNLFVYLGDDNAHDDKGHLEPTTAPPSENFDTDYQEPHQILPEILPPYDDVEYPVAPSSRPASQTTSPATAVAPTTPPHQEESEAGSCVPSNSVTEDLTTDETVITRPATPFGPHQKLAFIGTLVSRSHIILIPVNVTLPGSHRHLETPKGVFKADDFELMPGDDSTVLHISPQESIRMLKILQNDKIGAFFTTPFGRLGLIDTSDMPHKSLRGSAMTEGFARELETATDELPGTADDQSDFTVEKIETTAAKVHKALRNRLAKVNELLALWWNSLVAEIEREAGKLNGRPYKSTTEAPEAENSADLPKVVPTFFSSEEALIESTATETAKSNYSS